MKISYSLKGVLDVIRPSQGIVDFANAGLENVMLDMGSYHPAWELERLGKNVESDFPKNASVSTVWECK